MDDSSILYYETAKCNQKLSVDLIRNTPSHS